MYVIGTAGHVDHGKSTLVEALTGIDPDRWAEEKAREMTIDLGFAWLQLPPLAEEVGVIDVPGHRDFIENMLAGVGGIDLALFVVAADEGVMPQTREHLAILDLLGIASGVTALTKVDLIDDPDWLELVTLDVVDAVAGTVLADAPIVPVSARTGQGLDALRERLAKALAATPARPDNGRPRLPIDRVFSLSGFGTVVTGTLVDGRLRVGDAVTVLPGARAGRVRGLQTHRTKLDEARPGSRVAVNLTGLSKHELQRGDTLAAPGVLRETLLFDAAYRHLPDADQPLKHNVEVKLFVGSDEVMARTRVIGAREIAPGQEGWLQLAAGRPVAVARGDRFILRRPSPGATVGGGRVLDAHPGRRHRRFRPESATRLATLAQGTPEELLLQRLQQLEPLKLTAFWPQSGLDEAAARAAWAALLAGDRVVALDGFALSRAGQSRLVDRLTAAVDAHHAAFPLRLGMPREELRSRLGLAAPVFNALVAHAAADGRLVEEKALVRAADHAVRFDAGQQAAIDRLLDQLHQEGANSSSVKQCKAAVGDDLYFALLDLGRLVQVSNDVVYDADTYAALEAKVVSHLAEHGRINAGQVRDLFGTSRKYAIGLLEYLDEQKITRRVGDDRELARSRRPGQT